MIHAAKIGNSRRLQRTLEILIVKMKEGGPTTAEIQAYTGSMAPATDISELRRNGYAIDRVACGRNANGRQVNRYLYRERTGRISFDLSAIPPNAKILTAEICVSKNPGELFRVRATGADPERVKYE